MDKSGIFLISVDVLEDRLINSELEMLKEMENIMLNFLGKLMIVVWLIVKKFNGLINLRV